MNVLKNSVALKSVASFQLILCISLTVSMRMNEFHLVLNPSDISSSSSFPFFGSISLVSSVNSSPKPFLKR